MSRTFDLRTMAYDRKAIEKWHRVESRDTNDLRQAAALNP